MGHGTDALLISLHCGFGVYSCCMQVNSGISINNIKHWWLTDTSMLNISAKRGQTQGFTLAAPMRPGRIIEMKKHIIYEMVRPMGTSVFNSYMISCKKSSSYWSKCHVFGIIWKIFKNVREWCSWCTDIVNTISIIKVLILT